MRRLIRALTILTLAGTVVGAAATLGGAAAAPLVAGDGAVLRCDDGFGVAYATSGGRVVAVTVTGVADPGCEGGVLRVQLTGAGAGSGSGGPVVVPVDGDTADAAVTVPVTPQPLAREVDGFAVTVMGP